MCIEGACAIKARDAQSDPVVTMRVGEAVLIPAVLNDIIIEPQGECKIIEIYMEI